MEGTIQNLKGSKKLILAFGDSLTRGFYLGGMKYHPYTLKLNELLKDNEYNNYSSIPSGVNGETTGVMLKRIKSFYREESDGISYDISIVYAGTNDFGYLNGETIAQNIIDLNNFIVDNGAAASIMLTLPECKLDKTYSFFKERRQITNDILRSKINDLSSKIYLCDLDKELKYFSLSKEDRDKYWDDSVHYSPDGYDLLGEIFYKFLLNNNLVKKEDLEK